MLPVYDLKGFQDIDLRKYHIRDVRDALRFIEFVMVRLEEAKHVINKQANRLNTSQAIVKQMKEQQEKINRLYGAPEAVANEIKGNSTEAVVQTTEVEDKTAEAERNALLDEIRQAAADETTAELEGDAKTAEYDKYTMTRGKHRDMYYREGKMVSVKDVPQDIREALENAVGGPREDKQQDKKEA